MGGLCGKNKEAQNDASQKSEEKKQNWVKPQEADKVIMQLKINRDKLSARIKTLEKEDQKFEQKIKDYIKAGIIS